MFCVTHWRKHDQKPDQRLTPTSAEFLLHHMNIYIVCSLNIKLLVCQIIKTNEILNVIDIHMHTPTTHWHLQHSQVFSSRLELNNGYVSFFCCVLCAIRSKQSTRM